MTKLARRILVVDDNVDCCANVCDILGDLGHQLDTAHSGEEALELVRENHYDLALLDFKMPGMDGANLYREIKRLRPSTVAILITASASRDTTDAAREVGAWRVVNKPIEFAGLIELINQALQQPCVLIVDDNHDLCDQISHALREKGYGICLAQCSQQVQESLGSDCCQIALVDLNLRKDDTEQVLSVVRQFHPHICTVAVIGAGKDGEPTVAELRQLGADAICCHPIDVGKLIKTISKPTA